MRYLSVLIIFCFLFLTTEIFAGGKSPDKQKPSSPPSGGGCCGDGSCHDPENLVSCARDCCPVGNHFCGDGICGCHETMQFCPQDCRQTVCGNGECESGERELGCTTDCGNCPTCGDGTCSGSETCSTCSADCGACVTCGNGVCEPSDCPGRRMWEFWECSCRDCLPDLEACSTFTIRETNVSASDMAVKGDFLYAAGEFFSSEDSYCNDTLIKKYRTCRGDVVWERSFNPGCAGEDEVEVNGIAVDSSENVYVTGSIMMNSGPRSSWTFYIRKYNAAGGLVTAFGDDGQVTYPTSLPDNFYVARDITVDASGNVYVTGAKGSTPTSASDIFIMKFTSAGFPAWSGVRVYGVTGLSIGHLEHEEGSAISVDVDGNIWVGGTIATPSSYSVTKRWIGKFNPLTGSLLEEWSSLSPSPSSGFRNFNEIHGIALKSRVLAAAGRVNGDNDSWGEFGWNSASFNLVSIPPSGLTSLWDGGFYDEDVSTIDWAGDVAFDSETNLIVVGLKRPSPTIVWLRKYSLTSTLFFETAPTLLWEAPLTISGRDSFFYQNLEVEVDDANSIYVLTEDEEDLGAPVLLIKKYWSTGPGS